jgi:hypothetical protein
MNFNFCTYIGSQNPKVKPTLAFNFFIPKLHIPTHNEHTWTLVQTLMFLYIVLYTKDIKDCKHVAFTHFK